MLAVAGLAFAYTSCTDYSKDIDENSKEIESLSGRLATAEQQLASLKTDVASLQTAKTEAEKAIAALQTSLTTLQTKHDADVKKLAEDYAKADEALKAEIQKKIDEANAAHEKDVEAVKTLITALQTKVTDLETEVGKINETIKTLATKEYVDATFATKDALASAEEKIGALRTDLTAAEGKITALEGKYDENVKISEILVKIAAAQKAADVADSLARKSLGDVEVIKDVLGTFTEKGSLDAKIDLLDEADSTLKAELATKFNSSDFQKTFDEALKKAIEADGIVGVEIAKQITAAKTELEGKISTLRTYVDGKFSKLFSIAKQLKSLVFVPDLYVDGIEATEYTYADYTKQAVQAGAATTVTDEKGVTSTILAVAKDKPNWWNYNVATGNDARQYINVAHAVTYKMNPSTAEVPENLAFVSYEKQVITKAIDAIPVTAEFVSAANGDLKVNMNPVGQKVSGKGMASIFALQATVKNADGQDTTVTSDFANLYASKLTFNAVAFSKATYKAVPCGTTGLYDHLYTTAQAAVGNKPSVVVRYDNAEGLDLSEVVRTHIAIASNSAKNVAHADYAVKFPNNDYGISYKFELIDYTSGTYTTSESQHAFLKDGHILVPCASTAGKADLEATGEKAVTAVGRRPLVRVTVQKGDNIILVGFIKFEITKYTDYVTADPFTDWTYKFQCNGDVKTTTWDQMVDNVIKHSGLTKEEFCNVYVLDTLPNSFAVQYKYASDKFSVANANEYFGNVKELKDAVPGTTTDVIRWTLFEDDLSAIYKLSGHTKTIWVRYIYKGTTPTSEYEGIYVPLTVKDVVKPVGSVSKKLENYWFGDNMANAKINVARPKANGSTIPWKTDINQVWAGNRPVFARTTGFADAAASYKYYFAPIQSTYTINGVKYVLSVDSNKVYDKYEKPTVGIEVKDNANIQTLELNNALDITKGMYTDSVLYCKKGSEPRVALAILNQETGVISYQENAVAKELLNAYESKPSKFEAAELFANIGVTAYSSCNTALSLSGAVNPYYFLRPINADGVVGKFFIDGKDDHVDESNINLFDLFDFVDWRGEKFVKAPGDYTNLWYFKYYNVNGITVDLDNVTTTLDGGVLGTTKLSAKTSEVELSYRFGPRTAPTADYKTTTATPVGVNIVAAAEPNWGIDHYNGLIEKFGYIHYNNNQSTVSEDFTIRVPVSFTYDWGVVNTHVDILVKHI